MIFAIVYIKYKQKQNQRSFNKVNIVLVGFSIREYIWNIWNALSTAQPLLIGKIFII